MNPREALATLIDVAPLSENDRARLLAAIPSMTDEEVQKLGEAFAQEETALDERITHALQNIDTFIAQTPDEAAE